MMVKTKAGVEQVVEEVKVDRKLTPNDLEWTDHVLTMLSDDEKISGNPTTDGLRRIFETVLTCRLMSSTSSVVQSPSPDNEKRATVVHSLTYRLNPDQKDPDGLNIQTVDGSADVYWGNCDKAYRNHPVAVAETRAEGRALRRALKLRKVVAAEELAENLEDNPDGNSVNTISSNQINFIDVISKRLNINTLEMMKALGLSTEKIHGLMHSDGVNIIRELSRYQQNADSIPEAIVGYSQTWK